jgi:hypothetical protein
MTSRFYTHEQLLDTARLNPKDVEQVKRRRRQHHRLGFGEEKHPAATASDGP